MLKVRNGPRGAEGGEQVAVVYPFALVRGVVTVLVVIIAWIWISYEGGLPKRLSILVFLPIEAVEH